MPWYIYKMSAVLNSTTTNSSLWNTPQHHGPVVSVVTWLLIIAVVLAVGARTVTRYAIIHTLRGDDITALLAMVRKTYRLNLLCPLNTYSCTS